MTRFPSSHRLAASAALAGAALAAVLTGCGTATPPAHHDAPAATQSAPTVPTDELLVPTDIAPGVYPAKVGAIPADGTASFAVCADKDCLPVTPGEADPFAQYTQILGTASSGQTITVTVPAGAYSVILHGMTLGR